MTKTSISGDAPSRSPVPCMNYAFEHIRTVSR
jgi:hypothetical protein